MDLTRVSSSAMPEVWGRSSESSIPAAPRGWNLKGDPSRLPFWLWKWTSSWPGCGCPFRFASSGLGSNRSIWLGPPCWKRQITAFAFGGWCGGLGSRAERPPVPAGVAPRRPSRPRRLERARNPSPPTYLPRNARRLSANSSAEGFSIMDRSIHIKERVRRKDRLAEVGEGLPLRRGLRVDPELRFQETLR